MKETLWLPVIALFSCFSYAQGDTVIVRPLPIDDVLQNPSMGITTFQRFNGQATNPPLEWSEVGPVAKLPQAVIRPDFPDTTIDYLRWYWDASNLSPGNSAGKSSTSLCKRREHMGRRWQSGLCRIPTRTLFPLGINLLARGGPTSPVTKTGTSGNLIFLILPFSSIGASWWPQPDAATTEILISTAWTYLPSVIGVKAGVRTCPPSPIRRL